MPKGSAREARHSLTLKRPGTRPTGTGGETFSTAARRPALRSESSADAAQVEAARESLPDADSLSLGLWRVGMSDLAGCGGDPLGVPPLGAAPRDDDLEALFESLGEAALGDRPAGDALEGAMARLLQLSGAICADYCQEGSFEP